MKRLLLVVLVLLLIVGRVEAAVTIDSQETLSLGHGAVVSPLTWNFTNTAGSLLVCAVSLSELVATPVVTAISYNSVAMTLLDNYATGTPALGADGSLLSFYYLKTPATGLNLVSVAFTFTGTAPNIGAIAGCISFSGNDTTTPFGTASKNKETTLGTNTSGSATIGSTTSGNYVIGVMNTGSGSIAVTAPSAASWILNQSTHTGGDNAALSTQAAGGSITMAYTFTADIWSVMAVEVKASGGATTTCQSLTLTGAGRCG